MLPFHATRLLFFEILLLISGQIFSQNIISQKGLTTASFNYSGGIIKLYYPSKIAAGDLISVGFTFEAAGRNANQIQKALDILLKKQVRISDQKNTSLLSLSAYFNNNSQAGLFPAITVNSSLDISISGTKQISQTINLPLQQLSDRGSPDCIIPSHVLNASVIPIRGQFDGDASNTKCLLGDVEIPVIAESPGWSFALSPANVKGVKSLSVIEKGEERCIRNISTVQMNVSAGKLDLMKGEKTFIDVQIDGLKSLPSQAVLTLNNITSEVVKLKPANLIDILLVPDSVDDGHYRRRFDIESVRSGKFIINVNLDLPEPHYSIVGENGADKPPVYADNNGGIELHPLKVDGLKNGMSDAFKKAIIEVTGNQANKYPELDGCRECLKCIQSLLDEGKVALVGEVGKILLEHFTDLLIGKAGGALAWIKEKFDKLEKAEDIAKAIADAVTKGEMQVVQFDEKLCGYCLVSAIGFYDTKTQCIDAFFYCKGSKMCCTHSLTIIHLKYCVNEDGYKKPDTGMSIEIISQ